MLYAVAVLALWAVLIRAVCRAGGDRARGLWWSR